MRAQYKFVRVQSFLDIIALSVNRSTQLINLKSGFSSGKLNLQLGFTLFLLKNL